MTDIKDLLSRALPEQAPPIAITRESAVARGRTKQRQRRTWLAAGSAGLSTVAIVVAVALFAPGGGPSGQAGAPGTPLSMAASVKPPTFKPLPTSPTAPSTSPSLAFSPRPLTEKSSAATKRLTTQLRAAIARVKPDATTRGIRGVYMLRELGAFEVIGSQGGYKAWAEIKDSQGPGTMFVSLDAADPAFFRATFQTVCPLNPGFTCETRIDDATGAMIIVEQGKHPGSPISEILVTVVTTDGTELWVDLSNYSQNDQPDGPNANPHPQRPTPPLTADQVIDMLLSPGLTLYP